MGKTLYISDLDGTLLQNDAKLSGYTTQVLQAFIGRGGLFSVATARTIESTAKVIASMLPLPIPHVLMNGAMIYDSQEQRFVKKNIIAPEVICELLALAKVHGQTGMLYSLAEDYTRVYHEANNPTYLEHFIELRRQFYGKRMVCTDNLAAHAAEEIIYCTMADSHENLAPLHNALQQLPGLNCSLYPDVYINCWLLECYSNAASKYNAVCWLREAYDFDKIIGFGDNLNDIPLFEACDEAYAVANAREELKAVATGVIGANTEDGVAKFLEELPC